MTGLRIPALLAFLLPTFCALAAAFGELSGQSLTGCVLPEAPYIVKDSTRPAQFSGVAIDYLLRLEENLGFEISLQLWNDTWTAFIEHMAVCDPDGGDNKCECHIGVGSFTMTNERQEKINFVWPMGNEAHRMVSRKSDLRVDDSQNTWFVFKTFELRVWGLILFGIMLHAVGTVFFGPFRPSERDCPRGAPDSRRRGIFWYMKRFPAAVLFSYAHLLGHPFGEQRQGTPSFHRTAWLMLGVTTGLFLLTIYEASLTVLLFESTKSSPFRTLDDIKSCALTPERVAMIRGGASQAFWEQAVNTSVQREKCPHWDKVGMTVENLEEGFEAVKNNKADYFYSLEGSVLVRTQKNCGEFEPVGEPFFSTAVAFVMPQNLGTTQIVFETLSRETRILREQDGYDSVSLLASRTSCEDVVDATITAGKLWAFFIMYCCWWAGLLIYRCVFLWRRKTHLDKHANAPMNASDIVMNMHSMPTGGIPGVTSSDDLDPFDERPLGYPIPEGYPAQIQYPRPGTPFPRT